MKERREMNRNAGDFLLAPGERNRDVDEGLLAPGQRVPKVFDLILSMVKVKCSSLSRVLLLATP